MARRNTSDFDTFQRRANASNARTESTSSEYVDLIVVMAIIEIYGHNDNRGKPSRPLQLTLLAGRTKTGVEV